MNHEIMTIEEVAKFLRMHKRQVYALGNRDSNPLPIIQITDRSKRVSYHALLAWLQENELKL